MPILNITIRNKEKIMKEWFLGLRAKLWASLENKGRYTSFLGICIIIGSVTKPLIQHNRGVVFEEQYLIQAIYFVVMGVILIILPSYIKISKDGLEIKD
ncbi:MAG: hypothetical protein PF569_01350 [Candidatus Woesearchaeota archaeon]|jgi:sulfite exporter TauE/SafE|nr:hypothetical protein [Candidatus Woesearchaeota archaeon]